MNEFIPLIVILFLSVIIHEIAHGWTAGKLGDPTAREAGRLTLNPLKHIDPFGTLLVPALLKVLGFFPVGWAKPVPVNFQRLHSPKRDMIWVALAGPAANTLIAGAAAALLRWPAPASVKDILSIIVLINLMLAFFNLVPVPPLDGSRVVMGLLPNRWARFYARIEPVGLFIVFAALNLGLLNFIWALVVAGAGRMGVRAF